MRALLFVLVLLLSGCALDECQLSGVVRLGDGETLEGCRVDGMVVIEGDGVTVRGVVIDATGYEYGVRIMPGSSNVLVEMADVSGASMAGIYSSAWPADIEGVTVRNSVAHHNLGAPDYTDNWSGSGIVLGGVINALIEGCAAYENGELTNSKAKNGPIGIWLYNAIDSRIVNCVSYNNRTRPGHYDGGGFGLDGGAVNCSIENCRSWGNAGAGFQSWNWPGGPETRDLLFLNCVSENDLAGIHAGKRVESLTVQGGSFSGDVAYRSWGHGVTIVRDAHLCGERIGELTEKNNTYCEPNN